MTKTKSHSNADIANAYIVVVPCRKTHTVCGAPPSLHSNVAWQGQKYAQGFLLPAAIFILVILAALGAYALNITSLQQASSTQDVQGSRAYQAARAGVEWGAYQVLSPSSTALVNCPTSPSTLTVDGFNVSVTCTRYTDYFEQGTDHTIATYDVTATASFGTTATPGYIERQVQVTLSKCLGTDATPNYQCS